MTVKRTYIIVVIFLRMNYILRSNQEKYSDENDLFICNRIFYQWIYTQLVYFQYFLHSVDVIVYSTSTDPVLIRSRLPFQ